MAHVYANENFPRRAVEHLRKLGHNVMTVVEAGQGNLSIPDEEVLQFAIRANRVIITLNRRDFIELHRLLPDHAGIVVCTEDRDFVALAERVHQALSVGPLHGQLIRIYRTN